MLCYSPAGWTCRVVVTWLLVEDLQGFSELGFCQRFLHDQPKSRQKILQESPLVFG